MICADDRDQLLRNHQHARPAVVEVILVVVGREHGVDGNGHGADLDGAPEDRIELRDIEHQDQDPVVHAHAQLPEGVCRLVYHLLYVVVRVVSVLRVDGYLVAPSLSYVPIDEVVCCVEEFL